MFKMPIASMGLVYLPTDLPYKSTKHVGKYTMTMNPSWDMVGMYKAL